MTWAAFLPFVDLPWADGLLSGPPAPVANVSLAQGSDAQLVLMTLLVLGVATTTHLWGIRRRITAVTSLGASLVALAAAASFPATFGGVGTPAPSDSGFYLFVAAATVGAVAALVMVAMSFRGWSLGTDTPLRAIRH